LYDKQLTREDIVRKDFLGNPVDMDYIMDGKESISYREMMSDYYNIIKGTWNIFDVVNKVPQYKSIIDLLKTEYVVDKYSSIKSQLMNKIY
jgi:hypothetical protein